MQASMNRKWIMGMVVALVVLTTLSCAFSDLIGTTPEVEIREIPVTRVVTEEPAGAPIALAGIWLNPTTHSRTTIIWSDGQFEVIGVIDTDDGEVFPVTSSDSTT